MQSNFDAMSIFFGLLAVLPLGLLVFWLMSKVEHRRTPKWNHWQKTGHLR
jgi:ABC-type nitrate/sulfonate/bicarbonate transport system permease component